MILVAVGAITYWFSATATPGGPFGSLYGPNDASYATLNAAGVLPIHLTAALVVLVRRPQLLAAYIWGAAFLGTGFAALFAALQAVAAGSQLLGQGVHPAAVGVTVVVSALYAVACSILWADRPHNVSVWLDARRND